MVFSELDSKILLMKSTTDEEKNKWWVKELRIFCVRFADSKLGRKKENHGGFFISQHAQKENTLAAVL